MFRRRMAKSLVERYEQLLAQDPTSSVFVELAKALIAKGEHARAITVCEQGISHHPQSVTGRVLMKYTSLRNGLLNPCFHPWIVLRIGRFSVFSSWLPGANRSASAPR